MTLKILQNFYKAIVTDTWESGTGNRYVSVLPTPTSGRLVVNPSNTTKREIVEYSGKGTDGGGNYVTVITRGIGGTTDQDHDINEPVRMNVTAEDFADVQDELDLKLPTSYLDTDDTLAADSDTKIASQKATKTYSDTKVSKTGDETVAGVKTFSSSPIVPAPTTDMQAATKKYADDLAIAGAPDADETTKGIVEQATQSEANAGTETGGTGAKLFVSPDLLPSWLASAITIETTTGTTHSLTTTVGQRVLVLVAGHLTLGGGTPNDCTLALKYGGVTKHSMVFGADADFSGGFALQYTEIPGGATADVTVTTSGGYSPSLSNVSIIVMKIG
jgi:hypothetical protein